MKKAVVDAFEKLYLQKFPDKAFNKHQYYSIRKMVEQAVHEGIHDNAHTELQAGAHPLNTPLLSLLHDTRNDFDALQRYTKVMDKYMKEHKEATGETLPTKFYIAIEYIKSAGQKIMNTLDDYYIKAKLTTP